MNPLILQSLVSVDREVQKILDHAEGDCLELILDMYRTSMNKDEFLKVIIAKLVTMSRQAKV